MIIDQIKNGINNLGNLFFHNMFILAVESEFNNKLPEIMKKIGTLHVAKDVKKLTKCHEKSIGIRSLVADACNRITPNIEMILKKSI
ncbi:hypothetical protein LZE18_07410 [Lactobacillus mulieris]|nr:hypothetical protein [Lactobacillus mulieris]MCF1797972.1 hypothetical protein [Lactobacillus mulieris]MCF1847887.1 hypothetical protein [Lactobacillus mulieris]MCZ9600722.1 hypothetical protein [Lactobacillus mulieris]